MEHYLVYIWLGVAVLFALIEVGTVGLISIWFMFGAVAACLVAMITDYWWVQLIVFLLVSGVLLAFTRPLLKDRLMRRSVPTNADMLVGQKAMVTKALRPGFTGRVVVDNQNWAARSETELEEGAWCLIQGIQGATLEVCAVQTEAASETAQIK